MRAGHGLSIPDVVDMNQLISSIETLRMSEIFGVDIWGQSKNMVNPAGGVDLLLRIFTLTPNIPNIEISL